MTRATDVRRSARVPEEAAGSRFDQVLAQLFPEFSRGRLAAWIRSGEARLAGVPVKPATRVRGGEAVDLEAALAAEPDTVPEDLPLTLVHEDDDVLVVDKPSGLVVHPAAGHAHGTLQNALLHFDPQLANIPRAGIVHRLDKLTSGVMVVARSLQAHHSLVAQLQDRSLSRRYRALAVGRMVAGGTVDAPLGRHPRDRKRRAVVPGGKHAVTHYRIRERFRHHTYLDVSLETGRTHQIRVHLAHIRHPLVGDPVYGGRRGLPAGAGPTLRDRLTGFGRQALHAHRLAFQHPATGHRAEFSAPEPSDLTDLLDSLRDDPSQRP